MNTVISAMSRVLVNMGLSWLRLRKSYENAVTAFFDDYEFNTRHLQVDKPHYEPTPTHLILLLCQTKQVVMEKYNQNHSQWWRRYSILLDCYKSTKYREAVNSLMTRFQIKDTRHFIK